MGRSSALALGKDLNGKSIFEGSEKALTCSEFEFARWTTAPRRRFVATIMPTPTTIQGFSSISQHLRAIKKSLQDVTSDVEYVWSGEMRHVGGLKCNYAGSR